MTLELGVVTIDCEDPQRLAEFWTQALDMRVGSDYGEYVLLVPSEADGVEENEFPGATEKGRLNFGLQKVPEPRRGKNRVHVDFGSTDRAAEVQRLVNLGAKEVAEHTVPGFG